MPDQLPVPSAEEAKKFKSSASSSGSTGGSSLPVPSASDIQKFKSSTAQKKNPNPTPQVGKGASALPSTSADGKSSSDSKSNRYFVEKAFEAARKDWNYFYSLPEDVREKIEKEGFSDRAYRAGGIRYGYETEDQKKLRKILNTNETDNEVYDYYLSKSVKAAERKSGNVNELPKGKSKPTAKPAPANESVSVTPGKSEGAVFMAPKKPKTAEDFLQIEKEKRDVLSPNFYGGPTTKQQPKVESPKKVGALEDIGNTFMSSLNRFASGLAGLPNMAQKAALMMTTKMLGIDDEYNALPVASKKEIDNVMSSIAQRGGVPSPNVSRDVQDYFIKKSDEFLENTNKSDKYLNERFGDFFKAPSVEKATDLFLEIPKGFAGSLPYMINPMVGAVSAASEQYDNDIKEANGKLGWGQLVNAGVTGVTEYYIEKISNGILNKSVKSAIGSPEVAKDLAEGFVKSVLKDMGMEFGGEGLTQLTQSLSNDITKGKEIDWVKTANQTIDAAITGAGIAGGMRTTGAGVGYLSKKVMSAVDKKKVDKNTRAIMDLKTKKGPDNAPEVNAVIDSKINELNDENKNIINSNIDKVKSLSDSQLQEIIKIDNGIADIYKKRNAVVDDPNLTDEEKQTLIEHLKTQLATLNQQKDAIQKQATSEVPVQPEAGTGLQVAEGEPQAEPQGTTQESQREEIERRRSEDISKVLKGSESEDKLKQIVEIHKKYDAEQASLEQPTSQEGKRKEIEAKIASLVDENGNINFNDFDEYDRLKKELNKLSETQPSASGMVQMATPEQPNAPQEVKEEDVILSGLSNGFKAGTPNSFDPRSDEGVMENVQRNKSFATTATIDGKKYVVVGLRLNQDVGAKTSGRDGYTFAMVEDNGNLPANVVDVLTQKAIANTSSVYPNITNVTIDSFKPIEVSEQMAQPTVQEGQGEEVVSVEQQIPINTKEFRDEESKDRLGFETGGIKNVPVDILDNLQDVRGAKEGGNRTYETEEARKNIDNIKKSLQEKGWTGNPIIVDVDSDGYAFIDEGNHRLIAAKELGMKEIPVTVEFGLAREGISRYNNTDMVKNPTQIISKEEINKLKDIAKNRDYHIKYASIYLTDLGKPQEGQVQAPSAGGMVQAAETQQPTAEQKTAEQPVAEEPKPIKAADAETIAKEMQNTFGLNKTQSKAAAVVIDKIAGTMAKRAGTTKSKIMDAIVFQKGDINELSDRALFQKAERINGNKEDLDKAVDEIRSLGYKSPFGNGTFMPNGTEVEISNFDGGLWISSIFTPNDLRGKGLATETMVEILNIASKYNVPVRLEASPFGSQKDLTKKQLIDWYKKLGFKDIGYGELQKAPSAVKEEVANEGKNIQIEPVVRPKTTEKPKMPEGAKLVKPENFMFDGEYDVVVNGKTIGNIYYDRASRTWNDPNFDRSLETPWSFKWIYGEILGETKEEAVAELIKRKKQFPGGVKPKGDVLFQKAYHGGASKFNKFSTGKIGSGTNARFGGWGLYFTLDKARANTYASKLKNDDIEIGDFKINKSDYKYNDLKQIFEKTNSVIGVAKELLKLSELNKEKAAKELNYEFDGKYKESEAEYEKASLNVLDGVDVENSKKIIKDFQDRYEYAENGLSGMYNQQAYEYRKLARTALSEGAKLNNQPAYTYEVSIADDLNLLDFDKTISEDNYNRILNQALKENSKFVPEIIKNKDKSGRYFYFNVSQDTDNYDNDEELSLLMLRSGIDGNIMRSEGTQDIILFDENAIEINDVIQFQQGKQDGVAKGAMQLANDGSAIIYALTDPDVSTPLHEMAHVYENYLTDAERKTVLDWAGKKDWDMPVSEKFARGFEKYLAEGKSPNKELTKIFEQFKKWLLDIYNGIVGSEIDIKLNDDMRKLYDTMLTEGEEVGIKELPGYNRMMGEVDGIIEKSFKRGVPFNQTMDNVMQYMSKSKVYEDATDIQREAMVREVRKMFNKKEKKAPTAKQILGEKPTKTTVVIDEAKEIRKRLKALEAAEETGRKKGYKVGIAEADKAKKEVLSYVKSLKVNNKISAAQYGAIVNALDTNLRNPVIRERAKERIEKIISKANYVDQLERAAKIRSAINTAAKSKTLAPNIAKMAKNFAKINPKNVDVIDEYIDMANIVYESVGKPIRVIANEGMVNEYTDMRLKEAQKMEQDALMSEYQYLVDAGLIDAGMSMKDIQQYILDVEGKKIEEKKSKEEEIRKRLNSLFDVLSATANAMVNDGINPFTGDKVDISSEDKTLLKGFTKIDLDKLPITSAYRAQEALMNYIVNGKKFGMQAILAKYQGNENVKVAEDKGLKAANFRWGVGGSWWGSRKWAKEVESIPGLFTWIFRGESRGDTMMDLMGVNDILAGSAEAKLKRVKAEQQYIDKFLKTKPGGERFNSIGNTYQRLIYGYLSRSVEGSAEEKQSEFERRKRILSQVVQAMAQSRNKKLIEEGELFSDQFNKVKDAKTVEDIKGKFDKTNEEAVKFISNMFDADFDFVSGIAEGVYNLLLSKDEFYTPDMFRSIVDEPMNVEESAKTVDIPFESLSKQPAGTLMENKRIQNLPGYDIKNNDASNVEKILRLDFDASVFNAYEKSLIDAYTAIPVQKYSGFVNSKYFSKLFDSSEDQQLFKEILNYYINNERGKIGYKSDLKDIANFSNRLKSFSTVASLGSATAFIKQSVSSILNTSANLSNDKNALGVFRKTLFPNPLSQKEKDNAIAAQEFINKHGGQINLRGAETTADIKSAEKLIRESKKFQTVNDVFDVLDKAARLKMKPLNKGDVPPARASWLAYYVHSLKEQGKPYKNIDWATAEPNKKAIDYANNRVSVNQNASMPSIRGRAFTTKNVGVQLMMAYVMPFTSFLFNAKSRLKTDFTILTSKLATPEDKQAAGRSMAGTLLELPGYLAVSTAINYLFSSIANELVGYDEDEEEKKLRKKRYAELAVTKLVTDFISPAPNIGDAATLALFNTIIDAMEEEPVYEEDVPKQEPFRLFENRPQSMIGAMVEILAQPIGSTGRRASDLYKTMDMLVGDYYESNGKEFQFSREEKNLLAIAALMQGLAGLNLLPSEAESLGTKMAKTIEKKYKKAAKEE